MTLLELEIASQAAARKQKEEQVDSTSRAEASAHAALVSVYAPRIQALFAESKLKSLRIGEHKLELTQENTVRVIHSPKEGSGLVLKNVDALALVEQWLSEAPVDTVASEPVVETAQLTRVEALMKEELEARAEVASLLERLSEQLKKNDMHSIERKIGTDTFEFLDTGCITWKMLNHDIGSLNTIIVEPSTYRQFLKPLRELFEVK